MAILIMQDMTQVTPEGYDRVCERMNVDEDPPSGLISHTIGEVDGHFRVIDVWETRDDYERFGTERLMPTIREVIGEQAVSAPRDEPVAYELHHVLVPHAMIAH